jgi:hypothetical protein
MSLVDYSKETGHGSTRVHRQKTEEYEQRILLLMLLIGFLVAFY